MFLVKKESISILFINYKIIQIIIIFIYIIRVYFQIQIYLSKEGINSNLNFSSYYYCLFFFQYL